jgi:GT2 family glycosyltransferase
MHNNLIITASIVTYKNNARILLKAVDSFLNTSLPVKIYIVDNSPNDTLKSFFSDSRCEYYFVGANVGFGAAHNIILSRPEKIGMYHLVLNPDVSFSPGTLECLREYMDKNPDVGNVMPRVIYPNGELQYLCKLLPRPVDWFTRMFIPIKAIRNRINYYFEMRFADYDKEMNVPFLSGSFMFLRETAIEKVGLFDEHIFMYCEDTDLNRRIFQHYKTMYYPNVTIVHEFAKGSHKNIRLLWIHLKAAIYYLNKWGWWLDEERSRINNKTIRLYKRENGL